MFKNTESMALAKTWSRGDREDQTQLALRQTLTGWGKVSLIIPDKAADAMTYKTWQNVAITVSQDLISVFIRTNFNIRHALLPDDFQRTVNFCRWLLARPQRFLSELILGDEATFWMSGSVSTHSVRPRSPFLLERWSKSNKVFCKM